jgi:hypothetical protein
MGIPLRRRSRRSAQCCIRRTHSPHGLPGCRCRESCSRRPWQAGAAPPCRIAGSLSPRHGRVGASITSLSNTPFSLSRIDPVERKLGAQSSPPAPSIVAHDPRRLVQCVVEDWHAIVIGPVKQIADQPCTISAFSIGLAPGATESPPEVVQNELRISLGYRGATWMGSPAKAILWQVDRIGFRRAI